jgi:PAS domain S-box-containing protein
MQFQYTTYAIPLLVATIISLWVVFYSLRYRAAHSAVALAILALAIAEWSFAYALEIMASDLPTKLFWGKAEYVGIVITPFAWMVFAFHHDSPGKRLNYRLMLLLAAIGTTTVLLAFTTEYHGLLWNKITIEHGPDFSVLGVTRGPWFLVHVAYGYGLLLAGTILMLRSISRTRGSYRGQAIALIIAVVVPWLGNILYLSGFSPIPLFDLTPFAFTITVVATAWGIFGFQLLALSPVARDRIVEDMQDGMIVIDRYNQIADINPSALKLIGLEGKNVIGLPAAEAFQPWAALTEKYRDVLTASDELTFGEGENQRWYELRLAPLYNNNNTLLGRVISIHNMTSVKQAEELKNSFLEDMRALQEIHLVLSEVENLNELYQKMIALSQQRLGIDRLGLFIINDVTQELQGTFGVDEDGHARDESYYHEPLSSLQWPWEVLNSPNHSKLWENAEIYDNSVVVGGGWKAGATLWNGQKAIGFLACDNFISHKPARPYEAELISLLGSTFGHLIERKRAEANLQESEARYRQIVESASDIIYRTDMQGRFTYINPIGLHTMGLAREEELLGRHYLETIVESFRHRAKRLYDRQFLAKEKNTYNEFPIITADGHEVWLGQNVQLIEKNGQIIGFQALARDITDLVKTKAALALARDQALEASQLKSQLLAKVSHELRTPLGGILGYAELLRYGAFGELEEKQLNAANQIIDSTHYLTTMVNELLDQAQAESKSIILHNASFNVTEMVERVEANAGILASKKGLVLRKMIAPNVPETLVGDHQRLQQILLNLIGNAIKFTKKGGVDIRIYCPNDSHWAIEVADTGAGIPKEAQAYIFEPFRQVNNAITRENRGTGLGLSITKQLVEIMGGIIKLESEVNQGSKFTIILPILKETEKSA